MRFFLGLLVFFLCGFSFCQADENRPVVLVSIPPLEGFVQRLAKDLVEVESLVPAEANEHTFAPSARQVTQAARAVVWFRLSQPFERQVLRSLKHSASHVVVVNLLEGLPLIEGCDCPHCAEEAADPHVWLSVPLSQQMCIRMAETLKHALPDSAAAIQANWEQLNLELTTLNEHLSAQLAPFKGDYVLVSHAALGYFCQDYSLNQLSVEVAGKEPTPKQLTRVLESARKLPVRAVILQTQFNNKGAQMIAQELGVHTCLINPLNEDVLATLQAVGDCIAASP